MTNSKKNKKWVLASALLLAGVIAVGGTFAWFSSTDEVTNRLTASNSYGVSLTESFTPPEQWTPGQNVEKEVAAVNTGNVAAYVKLDLTDALSLTYETTNTTAPSITISANAAYVQLTEDEVIAAEAGGRLVIYAGYAVTETETITSTTNAQTGAVTTETTYAYTSNGSTIDVTVTAGSYYQGITETGLYVFERSRTEGATAGTETVSYDGYYVVYDSTNGSTFYKISIPNSTISAGSSSSGDVLVTTYTPGTAVSGVTTNTTVTSLATSAEIYVQTATASTANGSATIKFSGSIYKNTKTAQSQASSLNGYGYVVSSTSTVDEVYFIQAVYNPNGTASSGDEIIINIALDGTWTKDDSGSPTVWKSDNWTAVYNSSADRWTFYYNHVLSAGTTSDLLVTDLQLDTTVTNAAYTEFTYDLIVNLESVQVVAAETYENGITKIEIPSSSITWTQAVGTSKYDVSETATYGIYVNENGQVCVKNGTVTDGNNNLTWSFTAQQVK